MSFHVVKSIENNTLKVLVSGEYSITEMLNLVDLVKSECDEHGVHLALVDCREMIGAMTEAERFAGGMRIAQVLGSEIKAALLMPIGQVTKLGELAATNRGARFLVTDNHTEAVEWLKS